jgi:hypothetical protein
MTEHLTEYLNWLDQSQIRPEIFIYPDDFISKATKEMGRAYRRTSPENKTKIKSVLAEHWNNAMPHAAKILGTVEKVSKKTTVPDRIIKRAYDRRSYRTVIGWYASWVRWNKKRKS